MTAQKPYVRAKGRFGPVEGGYSTRATANSYSGAKGNSKVKRPHAGLSFVQAKSKSSWNKVKKGRRIQRASSTFPTS